MALQVRNTDPIAPFRRRTFQCRITDVSAHELNAACGALLMGYPEPDSALVRNVFVVDSVTLHCSGVSGRNADTVTADVTKGLAGTSVLTGTFHVHGDDSVPDHAHGTVSTVAGVAEVAAGTALYGYLTFANGATTTGFGVVTLKVNGHYKDEW
jgi:hypothetical protein